MKRTPRRLVLILLIVLIILIPLILTNAWGMHLVDDAYHLLQFAGALTEGSSTILAAAAEGAVASSPSLLFTLMVSALALLGVEQATAAAVLSALGWSATALAFLAVGKTIKRLPGAAIAALLLCFHPIVVTSSGTSISWVVALTWWAAASLLARRYFLLLVIIFDLVLMLLPLPPGLPVLQTTLAGAFAWSLILFLVGMGAEIAAGWFAANVETAGNSRLVYSLTVALVFVMAGAYQLSVMNDLFQTKPEARWALESDVAAWIAANTPANALIGASEKVGYLANRRTVSLDAPGRTQTVQTLQEALMARPANYLVSNDTLPWQLVANSRWFRLNYQPVAEFNAPYVAEAPYTIWRYQPPPPELGHAQALNARVPNRLRILGYQVNQVDLQTVNEAVITLYLEAAANTIEPITNFSVKTRLVSPADGNTLAEWDAVLPSSSTPDTWKPGAQIREQLLISSLPDLEPGAYPLNISLAGPESPAFWPISLDNDIERLDRLPVGYLVVPTAVDEKVIQNREAAFGDRIKLLGYSASEPRPGEGLELTLFWEASEPMEGDYVVFTHVLDGRGQLVANHDSVPGNGRYPTPSWLPGMTIVDQHVIQLSPDLAAGDYNIRVGLYDPESGERLPVVAGDGTPAPDHAFLLSEFSMADS